MMTPISAYGTRQALKMVLIAGLLASSAACSKKTPTGQVVAVVNGEEVTRRDLASEPEAASLSNGDAAQPALAALLNGVVDRKLAAAEAKRLEIDRTPQYVQQAKRLDEIILGRTLFDRWAAEMPQPSKRQIAAFVAENPQRFDRRKLFLVDRIETANDQNERSALAPLRTNDEVAAYLDAHSQVYARNRTVIDSATLPVALYRRLLALPTGSPLAWPQADGLTVMAIVEGRDAPLAASDRSAEAVKALRQQQVQSKLAALRAKATIAYQPGYRPTDLSGGDAKQP